MEGRTRREFVYAGAVVCMAGIAGCTGDRDGGGSGQGQGGEQPAGGAGGNDPTATEYEETGQEQQNQNSGGLSKSLRKQVREYYEGGQLAKIVQSDPKFNEENKAEHLYWEEIGTTSGGGRRWRVTVELYLDPQGDGVDSPAYYEDNRDELASDFVGATSNIILDFMGQLRFENLKGYMPSEQESNEDRVAELGVSYKLGNSSIREVIAPGHVVELEQEANNNASSGDEVSEIFQNLYKKELRDSEKGFQVAG